MIARALAVAVLVGFVVAGCASTVVLGSAPTDGGEMVDFAQPRDLFDGGGFVDLAYDGGGVDIAFGSDAAPVDLAQ